MRGKAGVIFIFVVLLWAGFAALAVQIVVGPGVVIRGAPIITAETGGSPLPLTPASGDLLEFEDGSSMHGELKSMDASTGLRWDDPAAKEPIDLHPTHIDSIRFAHAASINVTPTSRLRLANGDDLFGSVTALDSDHLIFNTWFGRAVSIPRESVQTITFLSSNYNILYEGPGDTDGWIIGNRNPDSWTFRDGTFISGASGQMWRDFKLSGSSTIEFDLAWQDTFDFMVCIYCDAANPMEVSGNYYAMEFGRDMVVLHSISSNRPMPVRTLGSAPLPIPAGKNKVRITIQSNEGEGTVAVFVDNVLAKRWKDEDGFSANGSGILFQQGGLSDAVINLSNFEVSQWQGRYEPETSPIITNVDVVRFINHDQAGGKITGISGGKIMLTLSGTPLQIPIQRVTQINFAATSAAAPARGPWEVRAHFAHGGSVSFQLDKWSDKEISGQSAIFGPLAFQPGQIRQLEFNLDRPKSIVHETSGDEFEGLDE